jgi:hypothetical protein
MQNNLKLREVISITEYRTTRHSVGSTKLFILNLKHQHNGKKNKLRNVRTTQHFWRLQSALVALLQLHGHFQVNP